MINQFKMKGLSSSRESLTHVFNMFSWNEYLRDNNLKGKRWKQQNK